MLSRYVGGLSLLLLALQTIGQEYSLTLHPLAAIENAVAHNMGVYPLYENDEFLLYKVDLNSLGPNARNTDVSMLEKKSLQWHSLLSSKELTQNNEQVYEVLYHFDTLQILCTSYNRDLLQHEVTSYRFNRGKRIDRQVLFRYYNIESLRLIYTPSQSPRLFLRVNQKDEYPGQEWMLQYDGQQWDFAHPFIIPSSLSQFKNLGFIHDSALAFSYRQYLPVVREQDACSYFKQERIYLYFFRSQSWDSILLPDLGQNNCCKYYEHLLLSDSFFYALGYFNNKQSTRTYIDGVFCLKGNKDGFDEQLLFFSKKSLKGMKKSSRKNKGIRVHPGFNSYERLREKQILSYFELHNSDLLLCFVNKGELSWGKGLKNEWILSEQDIRHREIILGEKILCLGNLKGKGSYLFAEGGYKLVLRLLNKEGKEQRLRGEHLPANSRIFSESFNALDGQRAVLLLFDKKSSSLMLGEITLRP